MKKSQILLVDDEILLSEKIKKILELEGYSVDLAHNGKQALALAKNKIYQLILCDISMPLMDGYEFYNAYKKLSFSIGSVIFISAKADFKEIRHAMSIGVDDYLVKPVIRTDLLKAVEIRLLKTNKVLEEIATKTKYFIDELALRDKCLQDIAHSQSHDIREPLATLMAVISIINTDNLDEKNKMLITHLKDLSNKLDSAVRNTVYNINNL